MSPTLRNGDIVFFKKYVKGKSILKIDQLVIFKHPLKETKLIKRIKCIRENCIQVLGDNIEFSDDSSKFGFINNENLIGIVTSKLNNEQMKKLLIHKKCRTSLNPK